VQSRSNIKIIFALTLVHFTGDFYSSFLSPLVPAFVEKLSLTMAQVGWIAGICRFLAFIVQPTVGYLADRMQTRIFTLGGLFLAAFFIPLSGIAPNFALLIFFLAVGSIGSSMFHPQATGMIPRFSGTNAAFSMSVFNTGGTLAFAVGPLFIAWLVATYGLGATPWSALFGLGVLVYIFRIIPVPVSEGMHQFGFIGSLRETLGPVWKFIALIWLVMVLRALVGQTYFTFMPVLLARAGFSLVSVGVVVSLFTVAGTLSGLICGFVADRMGFKPIFLFTHAMMTPALLLLLYSSGSWSFLGSFLAGFFTLATMPLGVVMAQELAPRGRSMVASLMMGLAYGLGGVFSPLMGKLADLFSLEQVLFWSAFIPILTLGLILFFPKVGGRRKS
jgi:FSR family fosmidomycin resistance protein-like MFS transporter